MLNSFSQNFVAHVIISIFKKFTQAVYFFSIKSKFDIKMTLTA